MKFVLLTWILTAVFWPFIYLVTQDDMIAVSFMEVWTVMTSLSLLFSIPVLLMASILYAVFMHFSDRPKISFLLWLLSTAFSIGSYSLLSLDWFYIAHDNRFSITVIVLTCFVFFSVTRMRYYMQSILRHI